MFDFVCKAGSNESFFTKSAGFLVVFEVGHHELHLLSDVGTLLIILLIVLDICKESPIIKVVDCIFEKGVGHSIAPKATTEPGGEQLHWFVSGIVWRGV